MPTCADGANPATLIISLIDDLMEKAARNESETAVAGAKLKALIGGRVKRFG